MRNLWCVVLGMALVPSFVSANQEFLNRFKRDTFSAMTAAPVKQGGEVNHDLLRAKSEGCRRTRSRHLIERKFSERAPQLPTFKAAGLEDWGNDDPRRFLEIQPEMNAQKMDQSLRFGSVTLQPWSGDYWALRSGAIAKRYADPEFPSYAGWKTAFDYFQLNSASTVAKEILSPAEKYDLLVGDNSFNLTQANWQTGKEYFDREGEVESWMGLCHGWAPASFMEPRPSTTKAIKTLNTQEDLQFRPDDMKALLTLKWANGVNLTADLRRSGSRFLGGRCNVKDPQLDPDTGRVIDPECFDLNPGSWHVAVVNQIARTGRPLIIDAAFDFEVWNQPVTKFSYRYFNPKTLDETDDLSAAVVSVKDPGFKDKFAAFRNNPRAVSVVGVVMELEYLAENSPSDAATDSPENDILHTVEYHYDLELDAQGNIVGGEWYQNAHPDFIWMPMENSVALHYHDAYVQTDADVLTIAPTASARNTVLRHILDLLQKQ